MTFIILFTDVYTVDAASKVTKFSQYTLSLTSMSKFAKKMGLKKAKSGGKYSYYVKNKNITIGYNTKYDVYQKNNDVYKLYVMNKSSKVDLWGIRPGMTRKACRKQFKKYSWGDYSKSNAHDIVPFGFEHGGDVIFHYDKKGKLKYWEMQVWYGDARW